MNVLFICSRNKLRSPTAEEVYAAHPHASVRSAGLADDADYQVAADDVEWADVVLVMEAQHKTKLLRMFKSQLAATQVGVLEIPDDYEYKDAGLVRLLKERVPRHVPALRH